MKRRTTILRTAVAGLAAAALVLAGCSSQGGKQAEEAALDTPRYKIAMITHGEPGDTFFDLVRAGADAAAAKSNIEIQYSADPDAGRQATLVDNAIDSGVDGIALTFAKPEAMKAAVKRANAAGIPVIGFNSGIEQWKQLGALAYYGTDEHLAGTAFGERLSEEGAEHALCVVQSQGQVALETRCDAFKEAFKGESEKISEKVYVTGTDMTSVQSTLQAKLQADSSIDYVVTLGAPFAVTALKSVADAGSDAKVATFDTNKELVKKIEDGSVQFAVDQQPYLQGYLTIDAIWLYLSNGNIAGGGEEPVLTGRPSSTRATSTVSPSSRRREPGDRPWPPPRAHQVKRPLQALRRPPWLPTSRSMPGSPSGRWAAASSPGLRSGRWSARSRCSRCSSPSPRRSASSPRCPLCSTPARSSASWRLRCRC
ncbi:MAG: substrate-binding domain-containing protein [Haloechinothrix sp.]